MTQFYVDKRGNYLGGFDGVEVVRLDEGKLEVSRTEPVIPDGAIEIPAPPAHGLDLYDIEEKRWVPYVATPEPDPSLLKLLANPLNIAALKAALK